MKITTPLLNKKTRDCTPLDYFTVIAFFTAAAILTIIFIILTVTFGGVYSFFGWLFAALAFGYWRGVVRLEFDKKEVKPEVLNEN